MGLWLSMGISKICSWDYGAILMGTYGVVVAAVLDLWGSTGRCGCGKNLMGTNGAMGMIYGSRWLRCKPYGDLWGCYGCGVGPMGFYGVLWLRCGTYGVSLWGYKSRTNRNEDQ